MTSTLAQAPSHTIWTSREIETILKVKTLSDWFACGVSIDSRTLQKYDLFVAIQGDHLDGHDYVVEALNKGASAALVSHIPPHAPPEKCVVVSDPFHALKDLAIAARARTGALTIGITGSVGKTGTKEMCGVVFGEFGQTHWSEKSYNNHWGVPLSLSRMHAGSDFAIFEMGMNHHNEIKPLSQMVRPHIGIITMIAPVHIENFPEGIEGIAYAKSELFSGIADNGIAILPHDIDQLDILKSEAKRQKVSKIYTFGQSPDADAILKSVLVASNGVRAEATILGEEVRFTLKDAGQHQAMNALAVLLAVKIKGLNIQKAAQSLAQIEPPSGRGKREFLDYGDPNNPVTLIDESYNASPVAMKAAFKVLALIDPGRGGRRIAVLGDMLELGAESANLHADLALPLKAANVDFVYTCGPLMKNLHDRLANDVGSIKGNKHADNSAILAEIVPDVLVPGDVVMVKGSLGSKMKLVVEALRAQPKKSK
jgi:UDP-N-acetylmuramoyl-tripeptide--D-alanyl-D-alanine ligase